MGIFDRKEKQRAEYVETFTDLKGNKTTSRVQTRSGPVGKRTIRGRADSFGGKTPIVGYSEVRKIKHREEKSKLGFGLKPIGDVSIWG